MADFTIYPAIDLRQGKVVRLRLGDPQQQTVFSDDPAAVARQWVASGATWLHVVNLDGAFGEQDTHNWQVLPQLTALGVPVQFGGGLRTLKDIARALNQGVARVVLGTAAIEDPNLVEDAVRRFGPARLAAGIDARDGFVRTHGWQAGTAVSAVSLAQQVSALGVRTVVHTDISRDGVLSGVNAQASASLARATGLQVIASGGVATLEDVRRAADLARHGLSGLIIGRALYEGHFELAQALDLIEAQA